MGSEMCIRDSGYGVSGLGRFRVNIFQQRNSIGIVARVISDTIRSCLLYTSDAADERSSVDLGGRRIIKKKNNRALTWSRVRVTDTSINREHKDDNEIYHKRVDIRERRT